MMSSSVAPQSRSTWKIFKLCCSTCKRVAWSSSVKNASFWKLPLPTLVIALTQKRIYPLEDKLEAINTAPEPRNQEEVRAYHGLLGYYCQFIPNLTNHIDPLNQLLKAGCSSKPLGKGKKGRGKKCSQHRSPPDPKFTCGLEKKTAFLSSKKLRRRRGQLLVHYDARKPLLLQTDASHYALGTVISHIMPNDPSHMHPGPWQSTRRNMLSMRRRDFLSCSDWRSSTSFFMDGRSPLWQITSSWCICLVIRSWPAPWPLQGSPGGTWACPHTITRSCIRREVNTSMLTYSQGYPYHARMTRCTACMRMQK